jgi:TolB-like protein
VRATVPAPVEYAITRALAKVPADRFTTADEFAQGLTAKEGAVRRLRRRVVRRTRLILALGVSAVVAGAVMLRGASSPAVIPSAATIAVLPFTPATTDTALSRLGQDLAATLSVSLDGVGDIRAVDRFTLLAQRSSQSGPPSLEQSLELGRRFGAGSVLYGTLARDGPKVRLDGTLYRSDRAVPLARVVARAPADSLSALTDSVTWAILHQVWQRGAPPTPSLASVTTHSVPALREFLEGERAAGEGHWAEAGQAYGRAIAEDSAFSLA